METGTASYERYERQIILKEFGLSGQQKLSAAKVLVIGAGGLGCPALQYLAAAGVGHIGIADDDLVSISNLHRQVLYSTFDIGFSKVEKAKQVLARLNPDIRIITYKHRVTQENAPDIIADYDVILDATDNFASRYLLNDACVIMNKPLVYGAVSRFEGQVAVFNLMGTNGTNSANYRDLFPKPPRAGEIQNCAEAGVLGVVPGIIGTMQASETIKIITGLGRPLINALLTFNALDNSMYELAITAAAQTRDLIPATIEAFRALDYELLCAAPAVDFEIDGNRFSHLLKAGNIEVVDVREHGEGPAPQQFKYLRIPLSELNDQQQQLTAGTIVVFCQSGKRSVLAARLLKENFREAKQIYSLHGGILDWLKQNSAIQT
jgi:molybdopterin/thiamine biosynthesis adenylyltransferase/rhodanese-related sulfurtransferase